MWIAIIIKSTNDSENQSHMSPDRKRVTLRPNDAGSLFVILWKSEGKPVASQKRLWYHRVHCSTTKNASQPVPALAKERGIFREKKPSTCRVSNSAAAVPEWGSGNSGGPAC